jgi:DNA (cytosine-5)-methyltransferase 1
MGYARAGFEVVGVDHKPQPRYPFEFHCTDALMFPLDGFDVIHASPPCQAYSAARHTQPHIKYPDLVAITRERLIGRTYVIENVEGAPLVNPVMLCGEMFKQRATDLDGGQLYLRRHRLFESSEFMLAPSVCRCNELKGAICGGVYGGGPQNRKKAAWRNHGTARRGGYTPAHAVAAGLMGIDWMIHRELTQAIPPAYTEWIGARLMEALAHEGARQ